MSGWWCNPSSPTSPDHENCSAGQGSQLDARDSEETCETYRNLSSDGMQGIDDTGDLTGQTSYPASELVPGALDVVNFSS